MHNRFVVSAVLLSIVLAASVRADTYAWCGYVLLEGLPVVSNDLAVIAFEVITPPENQLTSQPDELLQTRFSLDRSAVIVEACFKAFPSRELVLPILDIYLPEDLAALDASLTYTIFAPEGDRAASQASVLYYLDENRAAWEEELPQ